MSATGPNNAGGVCIATPLIPSAVDLSTRIKWWEPYRETRRAGLMSMREAGVLSPMFWLRVTCLGALTIAVLIAVLLSAYPGLQLPWPQLIGAPLFILAMFFFGIVSIFLVPRHVELRPQWVQINQGQHAARIPAAQIRSISLVEREDGLLFLHLSYRSSRGKERTAQYAVSPAVDRLALRDLTSYLSQHAAPHPSTPASTAT